MAADARLDLRLVGSPAVIAVTRGPGISDEFWLQVMAEWGTEGPHPGREIHVRVEHFLSRLGWLRPGCVRYGVALDWDEGLRSLLGEAQRQRRELDQVLQPDAVVDPADVDRRLEGSRFDTDRRALRPFQVRDVGRLLALEHGANFSVPGTGKTTSTYAVYEAEHHAGRVEQLLVVAPLSAFESWRTETEYCFKADDRPAVGIVADLVPPEVEVALVNYHRLDRSFDVLVDWIAQRPTMVVLDEAHRMKKGWDGRWGTACLNLAFHAARRDVLSGTPAPQGPADLVAILDFLWPGQARRVVPTSVLTNPPPADAGAVIAQRLGPLFVRTRKSELELRPPELRVELVEPDPLQRAIYDSLRDQYAGALKVSMGDRVQLAHYGDIIMYLLEAATNPHLLSAGSTAEDSIEFRHPPLAIEDGSRLWDLLQQYNQYETPAKFQRLAQLVNENSNMGRKTLIWTNFVRNLLSLERMFASLEPALVYGAIPSIDADPNAERNREAELDRFRHDPECKVLLANPASISEGVSLHHWCHDAVYLDRTFNAGHHLQSIDRIHRLGLDQDQETRITFLIATDTIDEIVDARVREKAERLGQMLEDPDLATMALPDEENYGPAIDTQADLAALFEHLRSNPA